MAPPRDFHRRWPTLRPPLRPPADLALTVAPLLAGCADPVLLLGVTPELSAIDRPLVAIDWNPDMVAAAWRGDDADHHVVVADWKAMPLDAASVGAAISDGAITMLRWPDQAVAVLNELWRVVRPGGRVVLRCFATPETPESVDAVVADALAGGLTFHAFKLRFNQAVAAEDADGNVASETLFTRFQQALPDRAALSATSGWPLDVIAEIDAYADSTYIHCYPSRARLIALLSDVWPGAARFQETSGYPLAERCPLLVLDRP